MKAAIPPNGVFRLNQPQTATSRPLGETGCFHVFGNHLSGGMVETNGTPLVSLFVKPDCRLLSVLMQFRKRPANNVWTSIFQRGKDP